MYIGLNALGINTAPFAYSPITTIFRSGEAGAMFVAQKPSDLLARRNKLTYSQVFGNAAWSKGGSAAAVDNTTVAPDGTTTAATVTVSANFDYIQGVTAGSVSPGGIWTASIYVAPGTATGTWFLQYGDSTSTDTVRAFFNPTLGQISTTNVSGTGVLLNSSMTLDRNGFYRVSVTGYTKNVQACLLLSCNTSNTGTIKVWGAQLEQGSVANTYQAITDWTTEYLTQVGNLITQWDATGTTPVTALEQQVGLQLDVKPIFLGPELVTNGRFNTDVSGWTSVNGGTISWVSGAIQVVTVSGGNQGAKQTIATRIGATYALTGQGRSVSGGHPAVLDVSGFPGSIGTLSPSFTSIGYASGTFTATGVSQDIQVYVTSATAAGETAQFDNISVREVITAPNTVGQPLRGSEMNPNPSDIAGWTPYNGTIANVNSQIQVTTTLANGGITRAFTFVVGQFYEFTALVDKGTSNVATLKSTFAGATTSLATGPAKMRIVFLATAASGNINIEFQNTGVSTVSLVSVKPLYGNHRSQSTVGAQATLSARYNKITARNANPVDLTNVTKAGDAASTLTVVNDAAALAAAGLTQCTLGNVYKLDNSTGVADATVTFGGVAGNTNNHSASVWARKTAGTANAELAGVVSIGSVPSASYTRIAGSGVCVSGTTLVVRAAPGAVVYFILPDLREACYSYLPTPQVVWDATTGYDDSGFPARIKYSGAQGYATAAVDFSGSTGVQAFAGVAKLSDTTQASLLGGSNITSSGGFEMFGPTAAAGPDFSFYSNGGTTFNGAVASGNAAPSARVVSGQADTSGVGSWTTRVNGAGPTTVGTANTGTGAAANAAVSYGGRGVNASTGAMSLGFTGDEFVSILRGGATPTTGTTYTIEQAVGRFMGLNV